MPGPFPGMDPYLEKPTRWYSAHNTLITYTEAALNAVLPPPYAASVEMRCYIGVPDQSVQPNLIVMEEAVAMEGAVPGLPSQPAGTIRGGTAVLEVADPALIVRAYAQEETREAFINVINVEEQERVVTTIELLSHTNKATRDKGRELYLEKQQAILASGTSLLEIDLLRTGKHTVAVPVPFVQDKPSKDTEDPEPAKRTEHQMEHRYDYLVCLHRAGRGAEYEVWPTTLRERLPRVAVPLDAGVPDVVLNLQAVFDRNYAEGAYRRKIDYMQEPVPPLTTEDAAWADTLLRAQKLRM